MFKLFEEYCAYYEKAKLVHTCLAIYVSPQERGLAMQLKTRGARWIELIKQTYPQAQLDSVAYTYRKYAHWKHLFDRIRHFGIDRIECGRLGSDSFIYFEFASGQSDQIFRGWLEKLNIYGATIWCKRNLVRVSSVVLPPEKLFSLIFQISKWKPDVLDLKEVEQNYLKASLALAKDLGVSTEEIELFELLVDQL